MKTLRIHATCDDREAEINIDLDLLPVEMKSSELTDYVRIEIARYLLPNITKVITPAPASIIFMLDCKAVVCDAKGEQIPRYQQGNHADAIRAITNDGYNWHKLNITGEPRP